MRKTCLNEIYQLAKRDDRVVFIGSDIGTGTLDEFRREIPERFLMEGVSEGYLIGMMTGLAMNGKIPYLNTIATFLTRRCYEQILLDAGLHRQPIRLLGSGGGMVYAPLGPTHTAMEDFAILRAIPHMTVIAPSDAEEMKRLIPQTLDYPDPIYIRLAKGGDPVVSHPDKPFQIGQAMVLREGTEVLLVATGITTQIALEAAKILGESNISAGVLHVHTLKPFDNETLLEMLSLVKVVVSIEEHTLIGGLGSIVAEILAEANFDRPKKFRRLAFPDTFLEEYGSQESSLKRYGVTAENAVATVMGLFQETCKTK